MELRDNLEQLAYGELIKFVKQLIDENKQLRAENEKLRAEIKELKSEIDQLKRNNSRQAAPFSKNEPKKNPKRSGRKPGKGIFRNRMAPSEEQYSGSQRNLVKGGGAC